VMSMVMLRVMGRLLDWVDEGSERGCVTRLPLECRASAVYGYR